MLYSPYLFKGVLLALVNGGDGLLFDKDIFFQLSTAPFEALLLLPVHVHCRVRLLDLDLLQADCCTLVFYETLPFLQLKMNLVHFDFVRCLLRMHTSVNGRPAAEHRRSSCSTGGASAAHLLLGVSPRF